MDGTANPRVRPGAPPWVALLVQIVGLCATAAIVWVTSLAPRLHHYTWISLTGSAVGYALLAWAWSAGITFALYLAVPGRERGDVLWVSLRTAGTAVWFAPAIILLTQLSAAALAPALVLVVSATRLLYSQWRLTYPPEPDLYPTWYDPGMFGENALPPPGFLTLMGPALGASLCIQAGVIAAMAGLPLAAGCFLAMAAAMLTIYALATGAAEPGSPRSLPQAVLGIVLTVVLASGLTVGGLSGRVIRRPHFAWDSGPGGRPRVVDSVRAVLRELFYGEQPKQLKTEKPGEPPNDSEGKPQPPGAAPGTFPDGSFPGVILLPEVRQVPLLVAPVTPRYALTASARRSYSIPFGGEYWFFRFLYSRPPANSYARKGSPTDLAFSTTDRWPLEMEARQKLDNPVDLSYCGAVRVEIWNADRYPGTVWMELFAMKAAPGSTPLSLGTVPVGSAPDLTREPVTAVPETLEFPLRDNAPADCSGFRMVFLRSRSRADRSARISISRITLVGK